MGKQKLLKDFTPSDIANRDLILAMLQYENKLFFSEEGQRVMAEPGMNNLTSLEGSKTVQRLTLNHFGFNSAEQDLSHYRTIFHHYYHSAFDYDEEILSSVFYMRANRCLYYKTPELERGDTVPDCELYNIDTNSSCRLYDILADPDKSRPKTILAAYSLS